MRRIILSLLFFLLFFSSQAQPCLYLDSLSNGSYLPECLMAFTDSAGTRTIDQLRLADFRPTGTSHPNFGTDGLTHWLTFTCQNKPNLARQFVIEVDIVYADEMSLYVMDGATIIKRIEHDSWRVPLWNREIPSRYFAFLLNLQPHQVVRVFIRAQESSGTLITPIRIWEKTAYEYYYATETTILILPAVILLFIATAGFVLFLTSHKRIWFFYAVQALGTAVYNLNIEGVLAHYAPEPFNQIKGYALGASVCFIANLLFTQEYVYRRLPQPIQWLKWACYAAVGVQSCWFLYVLFTPFQERTADIALIITGITASFTFIYLLSCLARGSYEARLYLLAIAPFLFIVVVRVLNSANLIATQDWHYYLRYYAPLSEIIVLGVGVINQLIREREATLIKLSQTKKAIIMALDSERERISADLHDDLGGVIASINHQLTQSLQANSFEELRQKLQHIQQVTTQVGDKVRTIAHNLMPPDFEQIGLVDSAQQLVHSLNDPRFRFFVFGEPKRFSPDIELNIYRILSELIHNAQKHAQAQHFLVQFLYHKDTLTLVVEDDGIGNRLPKKKKEREGIGLRNIASRVNYLHARWLTEATAQGTTTLVEIPYEN
ncbi:sensor histidine kinase [Spirosoma panaciterrae]|uniref:sensor histidine kinase n=1 Tax=Spirosoma panaciterrae TaxID=496058 RepID=UPI00036F3EB2|nr:7TM-DISM domain-containing protein [Spirosoma panaciterrae]